MSDLTDLKIAIDAATARADAAEARVRVLEEALTAAVRAANLALFVIQKHGVMPNDQWKNGFDADLAVARAALASKEEGGR